MRQLVIQASISLWRNVTKRYEQYIWQVCGVKKKIMSGKSILSFYSLTWTILLTNWTLNLPFIQHKNCAKKNKNMLMVFRLLRLCINVVSSTTRTIQIFCLIFRLKCKPFGKSTKTSSMTKEGLSFSDQLRCLLQDPDQGK